MLNIPSSKSSLGESSKKRRRFSKSSRAFLKKRGRFFQKRWTFSKVSPLFFKVYRSFLSSPKEGRKHHCQKKNEGNVNDSKIHPLARTHTRALQQFLCFCFHNLHRFLCNSLLFNHLPVVFGQLLTLSKFTFQHPMS